jgi:hypothetical protein
LKISDADTYDVYYEELKKKKAQANTQYNKTSDKQSGRLPKKNTNRRQTNVRSRSTSNNEDSELEEGIELSIEEAFESVNESENDDNRVEMQMSRNGRYLLN